MLEILFWTSLFFVNRNAVFSLDPCNDLEVDPYDWEYCEDEPNEDCQTIAYMQACAGADRWERYQIWKTCRSATDKLCASAEVPCKTEYRCKWVSSPGSTGHCVTDFIVTNPISTSGKANFMCDPAGG